MTHDLTPKKRVPYEVMNDRDAWAHHYDHHELLIAGVNFLHNLLKDRAPGSPLLRRVLALGNHQSDSERTYGSNPDNCPRERNMHYLDEVQELGTFGYSLWHLRNFMDSPGFRYEFNELSKIDLDANPKGAELVTRGQGFTFYAAAMLALEGFSIEFIKPDKTSRTPDFFARRDQYSFACEATSKHPEKIKYGNVREFWSHIYSVVERKSGQFKGDKYRDGVLLIDCSPIFDMIPTPLPAYGGTLHYIPNDGADKTPGQVPLLKYDASEFSSGLRKLESLIKDVGIRSLGLWKRRIIKTEETFKRQQTWFILGTMEGSRFWTYFEKAVVFPGPNFNIQY